MAKENVSDVKEVKSRYRGNHHANSTHDICKFGKRSDEDVTVKPWNNMVRRRKNAEATETVKVETSASVDAKRGAKNKPSVSLDSKSSSVKSIDKSRKKSETQSARSGSGLAKKVPCLRNEKSITAIRKVPRISDEDVKDSAPTWIEFRKKVVHEHKTQTDLSEGSEREKIALRHRNVEGEKKMMRLFNHVIEEAMSKFTSKNRVQALIGAFETVISLQDTNTSHNVQNKTAPSASKVNLLESEQ